MSRFILLTLSLLTLYTTSNARSNDTIKIEKLTYYSDYEQKNFEDYIRTKKPNSLGLSLCLDSTTTQLFENKCRVKIDNYLNTIKNDIAQTKSEKSKINKIFKSANQNFFIQYDLNSISSKFYSNGLFNCVTGTLFFSHMLDSLSIPYTIKEGANHVFILAYPNTFSIPLESTNANMKTFIPDENFKKHYVDFLVESKSIQRSEVISDGNEVVFNKYYYPNQNINATELIGLIYYNSGLDYLSNKDFKHAFQQFEKGYLLYPSDRIRYVLTMTLLASFSTNETFHISEVDYLSKLSNYSQTKTSNELVINKFQEYTQEYLLNDNNENLYEQIYNRLITQLEDSATKTNISTIYFHERSRVCSIKGDNDKSWYYINEAYKINPNNLIVIERLQYNFILNMKPLIYNEDFISNYEQLTNKYPALIKNTEVLQLAAVHYLYTAHKYFSQNNTTSGANILTEFELFLKANPNYKPDPSMVSLTYCEAASAYYRQNNIDKCKSLIERGLALAPNNDQLIRKYKVNITQEIK